MQKTPILIAVVILILGCVSEGPAVKTSVDESMQAPNQETPPVTGVQSQHEPAAVQNEIDGIRSQLQTALVSGGISPESFNEINGKISELENQEQFSEQVQELRGMLSQLSVGGEIYTGETGNRTVAIQPDVENKTSSKVVIWHNMENGSWVPNGDPPVCPESLVFQSPVDLKLATSILYPGQVRGGDFKPHGGFRTDGAAGPIEVTAPMEGYIWNAARFYDEFGLHYMFDIQHPCGIMYRLGHLGAVSEKLESIFDDFPESAKGDSRTRVIDPPVFVELGETIATDTQHGSGFDWGVYDLRKENRAAQDPAFREAHRDEPAQAYHALCWFDYLPPEQEQIVRSLPPADGQSGKNSDYC